MLTHRPFKDKVTVRFVMRDDGGLQAICEAIPGFYLSGKSPKDVMDDVAPVIEGLMKRNQGIEVQVFPLKDATYLMVERAPQTDDDMIPDHRDYLLEPKKAA